MQAPDLHRVTRLVESWFARHQRPLPWRRNYDPYHVWVSEVMLQQTRMEVVLPYFSRFIDRFPTLDRLAEAAEDEVTAAWSGLGYYRRARMLRDGAAYVAGRFGGVVPSAVNDLMQIPGIGRYTAGAIASIAWNRPAPIVDGNVARIVSRLFGIDEITGSAALMRRAWRHAEQLVSACRAPRNFNQGLMEIGATICRPGGPSCDACPLKRLCVAARTGRAAALPRAKQRKPPVALKIPLYLVTDGAGRMLMRRENGRLMKSMYHLPHGNTLLLPATPLRAERRELLGTFRHTVTTRQIEFALYTADLGSRLAESQEEYEWIDPAALQRIPHPSYVAKAVRLARLALPGGRRLAG